MTLAPPGALITPLATVSWAAGTLSSSAARSTKSRRASAAMLRRVAPPSCTPVEPDTPPWSGVRRVSASTTETRSTGRSSSSATIWAMATSTPWPTSGLPKKAVTRPSGPTASQASIWAGSISLTAALAAAAAARTGTAAATIRAPMACSSWRREA